MFPWVAFLLPLALQGYRVEVDLAENDTEGCATKTKEKCSFGYDCDTPHTVCVEQDTFTRNRCFCKPGYCFVNKLCEPSEATKQMWKEAREKRKQQQAQREADQQKRDVLHTLFREGKNSYRAGKKCYQEDIDPDDSSGAAECKEWFDAALQRFSGVKSGEKPSDWDAYDQETVNEYQQKAQDALRKLSKHIEREKRYKTPQGQDRLMQKRQERQQEIDRLKEKRLSYIQRQPNCVGKPVHHCGWASKDNERGHDAAEYCRRHYATSAVSFSGYEELMYADEEWHFPVQCYWLSDSFSCTSGNNNYNKPCNPNR